MPMRNLDCNCLRVLKITGSPQNTVLTLRTVIKRMTLRDKDMTGTGRFDDIPEIIVLPHMMNIFCLRIKFTD